MANSRPKATHSTNFFFFLRRRFIAALFLWTASPSTRTASGFAPPPPRTLAMPPAETKLCAIQRGYDRSTERAESYILPTLQKAFGAGVTEYEIVGERIVQPNAVGMRLRLPRRRNAAGGDASEEEEAWPGEVFLKQVLASDYVGSRKDWSDLRRTLLVSIVCTLMESHCLVGASQGGGVSVSDANGQKSWGVSLHCTVV